MDDPPQSRDGSCGLEARAPGDPAPRVRMLTANGRHHDGYAECKARRVIGANLEAAGWLVQSHDDLDLTAGSGIAVREFPMKPGCCCGRWISMRTSRTTRAGTGSRPRRDIGI